MNTKTHIALVSIPIYSHLRSILEFSKRLVHLHQDIHVTCMIPTTGSICNNTKALVESLPSSIDYMFLPPPNLEDLPHDFHPALLVHVATSRSMQSIDDALKKIHSSSSLVAIVCDGLITEVLYLSKKLNIPSFIYFPSNMMLLSLVLYTPKMDETMTCEYRDLLEPLELPGCVPVDGKDLPEPLQDRSGEEYKVFIEGNKRFYLADGVLVNSFLDMEAETIRVLHQEGNKVPYAYAIGPFIQKGLSNKGSRSELSLRWLDEQEDNSILYISFGSGGALSQDQLNELAWGLELSGQKFIWVLRSPSKFGFVNDLSLANEDPIQFIPNGFLERTKDQGLVVPYWAPQIEILGHSAIGGFISHCGWNSTLESVVNGIPMITWPLFAEQKMNAAILSKGLKVALRPKLNDKGIVEREEVAMVIKNVMVGEEGKGIRQRMKELKDAAANAVKEDGSSTRTLAELVQKWKTLSVPQCN